jgi:hypothetical protein
MGLSRSPKARREASGVEEARLRHLANPTLQIGPNLFLGFVVRGY